MALEAGGPCSSCSPCGTCSPCPGRAKWGAPLRLKTDSGHVAPRQGVGCCITAGVLQFFLILTF